MSKLKPTKNRGCTLVIQKVLSKNRGCTLVIQKVLSKNRGCTLVIQKVHSKNRGCTLVIQKVHSSCSTSRTCHIALVTNHVISHERGRDVIVSATNGTHM